MPADWGATGADWGAAAAGGNEWGAAAKETAAASTEWGAAAASTEWGAAATTTASAGAGGDWGASAGGDAAAGGAGDWGKKDKFDSFGSAPKTRSADPTVDTSNWESAEADDDEVHVMSDHRGLTCWKRFEDVKFPPTLVKMLTDGDVAAFEKPTTIQSYVWPAALQKEDIIGVAKTGSGKTLAFLLPSFLHILNKKMKDNYECTWDVGPLCLVMAPTRELVVQIYEESQRFGQKAGITTAVCYGGADKRAQLRVFNWDNPAVCVATPGRLADFLRQDQVKLANIKYLVLDEADRMLDMGFEPQIREILEFLPAKRISMMFSATFPPEVKVLAKRLTFSDAIHIQIGSDDPLTGNKDIKQEVEFVEDEAAKSAKLYSTISAHWDSNANWWKEGDFKYLVFAGTKRECNSLSEQFSSWKIPACALHGDLDQHQRESSLQKLKDGTCKVLFATDVASRGLDIKGVTSVINYTPAGCIEDYVHRIGRTGRAGAKGTAVTYLLPWEHDKVKEICMIMKKGGAEVPQDLLAIAREAGHGGGGGGKWGGRGGGGYSGW